MTRIAIIAGEPSGDILAASLIKALNHLMPDCQFEGIAGLKMQAEGCQTRADMSVLSVMGLAEVLRHLPTLLALRKKLVTHWLEDPPDVFIGVDAPDFNLPIARRLQSANIPTIHYVSPSIWAWRQNRAKKWVGLAGMLTLFPFEPALYQRFGIPTEFVGHPLADELPFDEPRKPARIDLGIPENAELLTVMPGSRQSELDKLLPEFLLVAQRWLEGGQHRWVCVPTVKKEHQAHIRQAIQSLGINTDRLLISAEDSQNAMIAADVVLLASGTAVLEGMLLGRKMVAAYRTSALTYKILMGLKLLKVRFVTLPNNLTKTPWVPEYIQHRVTADNLSEAVLRQHNLSEQDTRAMMAEFEAQHQYLKRDAAKAAAIYIQHVIKRSA